MILKLQQHAIVTITLCGLCLSACENEPINVTAAHVSAHQIEELPGNQNAPSFSPDGKFIAFDATVNGNTDIFIRNQASGETNQITKNDATDRRPSWSPDGKRIAFISNRHDQTGIWTVDKDGSNLELLYSLESGYRLSGRPLWAPDGTRIAFTLIDPAGDGNITWGRATVATINTTTGALSEHTTIGDEWWPSWGPNSEWLYYYLGISDHIEAVHTKTGEIRPISNDHYVGWQPMVSPDGKSIVFVSAIDRPSVFVAPIDGSHAPIRITRDGNDGLPSFFPDGKSIIFTSDQSPSPVIDYNLTAGERTTLAENGRYPQELSDGNIAFLTPGIETWDMTLLAPDGTLAKLDTKISPVVDFSFSPDGENIAVVSANDLMNDYHIQILNKNGKPKDIVIREHGKPETPVWCDDNETLLFSARESWADGVRHTWAINIRTKGVSRITNSEINSRPTQCTDGGERITYFQTMNGSGIRAIEKNDDVWGEILSIDGSAGRWSPDGKTFAYTAIRNGQTDIFIRNAYGEETQITNDGQSESIPSWSRDGQRLLFSVSNPNRKLWMVDVPELPWVD